MTVHQLRKALAAHGSTENGAGLWTCPMCGHQSLRIRWGATAAELVCGRGRYELVVPTDPEAWPPEIPEKETA